MTQATSKLLAAALLLVPALLLALWVFRDTGGDAGLTPRGSPGAEHVGETGPGAAAGDATAAGAEREAAGPENEPGPPAVQEQLRDAVTGRVVDEAGQPVAAARVEYCARFDEWYRTGTAADGRFRLEGVPPFRDEKLIVTHTALAPRSFEVARYDGGVLEVGDLVLEAAGTVSGHVVSDASAPLAGAVVKARPRPNPVRVGSTEGIMIGGEESGPLRALETVTGPDGAFRITGVPAGPLDLFAFHSQHLAGAARNLAAVKGAETGDVNITLRAGLGISGTLLDARRDPLAGALVLVDKAGKNINPDGFYGTIPEDYVRPPVETGRDGAFAIHGLEEGDYTIRLSAPAHLTTYRADIPAGTSNLEIVMRPSARVSGAVTDAATDQPIRGFAIAVDQPGVQQTDLRIAVNEEAGTFHLDGLFPGAYALSVSAPGHLTRTVGDLVARPGGSEQVDVGLERGAILAGRLLFPGREPVGERDLLVQTLPIATDAEPVSGRSRGDGAFRLTDLPAGRHRITALSLGGLPAAAAEIELVAGETQEGLELTYEYSAGLAGTVCTSRMEPVRYALVALTPAGEESWVVAKTDLAGRYTFTHLPPREYRVRLAGQTRTCLAEQRVVLEADRVTTLDLFEPARGTVMGTVTCGGAPVAGVEIDMRCEETADRDVFREVRTDQRGFYRADLYPGVYTVRPDLRAVPRQDRTLEVAGGATYRHDIALPAGRVSGRIVDGQTGEPVSGAKVWARAPGAPAGPGGYPVSSDREGRFLIEYVDPGTYEVTASFSGYGYQDLVLGPVEVPGSEIAVGDLALKKGLRIRCRVVNGRTGSIETPVIRLSGIDRATGEPAWQKQLWSNWTDYYYESGLGPGAYRLEGEVGGLAGSLDFELKDSDRTDLVLVVEPR